MDPFRLPLTEQRFQTLGLFGGIQDASPDGWGRHLLDRAAGIMGMQPTEFDYLTVLDQDSRIGAVAFGADPVNGPHPYEPKWRPEVLPGARLDLAAMIQAADRIMNHEELSPEQRRFLLRGSSVGGAQPKAAVVWQGIECIAKFSREFEAWPTCRIEYAAMQLASLCGIRIAPCHVVHVGPRDVLLSERFDRACNGTRYHVVSARTLTGADDPAQGTYADIAMAMRRFCDVRTLRRDLEELFRRMVFNILINNHDDHLLNHGFVFGTSNRTWRLSPGYDIVPQPRLDRGGPSHLTLGVGEQGRVATMENALSGCETFGLQQKQAKEVIAEMRDILQREWVKANKEAGVPDARIDGLREAYRLVEEG
jgi:serine/threonine-protein kinase HipA